MSISLGKEKENYLIVVDLDGTILNKDFATLNDENKKTLMRLKKEGHRVCIATGRNYLSAMPFYEEMKLDTFLVTYNGAYVNHPFKENSIFNIIPIANSIIKQIIAEKIIK